MKEPGSGSVSFDRAAEYYDRTRSLPVDTAERLTRTLADELRGRGTVLEAGVGTGRIALPLSRAGIPMTGVDLSAPMLRRLAQNAGGTSPFPVIQADATALPFRPASFGAALACHVLHLIPRVAGGAGGDGPGGSAGRCRADRPRRPGRGVVVGGPGRVRPSRRRGPEGAVPGHERPTRDRRGDGRPRGEGTPPLAGPGPRYGVDRRGDLEARGGVLLVDVEAGRAPPGQGGGEETRRWAAGAMGDLREPREGHWEITWRAYDLRS